jgi:microcystin-dependent protein
VGVDANHPLNHTGGAATHTISQQELPPHIHDLFAYASGDTNMSTPNFVMNQWTYPGQYLQNGKWYPRFGHTAGNSHAGITEYPNNPMSIEQPYVAVCYWRRVI